MGETLRVRDAARTRATACGISGEDVGPRHVRAPARGAARPESREVGFRHVDAARSTSRTASRTSRSSTRCSPRTRCWASNTATRRPSPNQLVDLGSAVRRFRQRRAGRDRPVHRAAAKSKWGRICGLVHAAAARLRRAGPRALVSARPSATCSFARSTTCRCACRTTPAQIFHLLRRQMMRDVPQAADRDDARRACCGTRKRCRRSRSSPNGQFHTVIGEVDKTRSRRRCGAWSCAPARCYYELLAYRRETQDRRHRDPAPRAAVPVPARGLQDAGREVRARRRKSSGARKSRRTRARGIGCARMLRADIDAKKVLAYAGRPGLGVACRSATPRSTYAEQKQLIEDAFADEAAERRNGPRALTEIEEATRTCESK